MKTVTAQLLTLVYGNKKSLCVRMRSRRSLDRGMKRSASSLLLLTCLL